jgi:pseudolysin
VKTLTDAFGSGYGGNEKMGKLTYGGNLPLLNIERDQTRWLCYLKNTEVTVKDAYSKEIVLFGCKKRSKKNIYWDDSFDAVNGGYSPSNDALFAGHVIKGMYQDWYQIPALKDANGNPMMLNMLVHLKDDNAYWDGQVMIFGDGISMFYPLTSLGVGAHEVSHGFTQQHSNLNYYYQSGGLNESFSDMAAQAAEFYATGKNSWQIGPEIMKGDGALRYMDTPSKDCGGREPGDWCSIDNMSQYWQGLDVHYSSGIFNRVFYLMGTANGWDTKKAFDVMVQANRFYWTSDTDFAHAACGVMSAAQDLQYDLDAVSSALLTVGLDPSQCI